jgi:transposase
MGASQIYCSSLFQILKNFLQQSSERHWTHIARAGMAHQWQDCPIGGPKTVNQEYLERLKELVSHSPRDYGYPFMRWTGNWLNKHLSKEFGIDLSDRHINRLLKQMGLSCKPKSNTENNTSLQTKNSKILICDLESQQMPITTDFLLTPLRNYNREESSYRIKY